MKVLVAGASGQLAGAIVDEFSADSEVLALSHAEMDITDLASVRKRLAAYRPEIIFNCAAYNNVDGAESDAVAALSANALGVRVLARAAADGGATLVHYSTDFVFDGRTDRPYVEDDKPSPCSVYGSSKLLGEWFASEIPGAYVLRVESLFGGRAAKSSVDRIIDAVINGREARVFVDRTVSPSYVVDVSAATRALVASAKPGLYHVVSSGYCTWYELAQEIARQLGHPDAPLVPVSVEDVVLPAARPQFAALSNAKLTGLGVPMPSWRDAVSRYCRSRSVDPPKRNS
jgi:dTDP-4-dehydrorhamnose reductase